MSTRSTRGSSADSFPTPTSLDSGSHHRESHLEAVKPSRGKALKKGYRTTQAPQRRHPNLGTTPGSTQPSTTLRYFQMHPGRLRSSSKDVRKTTVRPNDSGVPPFRKEKKEIISTRCLEAVKETMEVIKDNLEVEGLFTTSGNLRTRKKIQSYLSRGDVSTLRNWGFEFVIECAAALKIFLQNLPQPLIPERIQQLVVAENSGVPEKTIANDALGLLKEEVNGRHKELLLEVFTFLKEAAVKVNTSELTGCNLPLKLLPVFFAIESNDPQKFRDIATVFHEIIMEAPEHLKSPCRKIPSREFKLLERFLSQDVTMPSVGFMNTRPGRNQPTGENAEWRVPVPRVPHTRVHPWLGRVEHSTSA